jgi:ribosomal protein L9
LRDLTPQAAAKTKTPSKIRVPNTKEDQISERIKSKLQESNKKGTKISPLQHRRNKKSLESDQKFHALNDRK